MQENITLELNQRLLTEKEVAKILNLSVKTLQTWRHKSKNINYVKIGRSVKYKFSEVQKFINSSSSEIQV